MAKQYRIVIVTNKLDIHADIMILELRKRGYQPVRLHPADFPTEFLLTLGLDHGSQEWDGEVHLPKSSISIDEIRSIWWRRPESSVFPETLSSEERAFARAETREMLIGLWNSIPCYWMSFPPNIRQASNKIEQLQRAARLGFCVPRTLVSNDPARVSDFYEACGGQIIYKTLYHPLLRHDDGIYGARGIYTTSITQNHMSVVDSVRTAPCLFQELIPKRLELRVTIIGDEIFPCEIDSQQHELTRVDWRHYDVSIPYRKGSLPLDIAEKCFALTKSYGLNFSALDLILTPEGQYVFLENNPNGQWMFVHEQIPEFKMVEVMADYLIRGKA